MSGASVGVGDALVRNMGEDIFCTYIGALAPCEINISRETRTKLQRSVGGGTPPPSSMASAYSTSATSVGGGNMISNRTSAPRQFSKDVFDGAVNEIKQLIRDNGLRQLQRHQSWPLCLQMLEIMPLTRVHGVATSAADSANNFRNGLPANGANGGNGGNGNGNGRMGLVTTTPDGSGNVANGGRRGRSIVGQPLGVRGASSFGGDDDDDENNDSHIGGGGGGHHNSGPDSNIGSSVVTIGIGNTGTTPVTAILSSIPPPTSTTTTAISHVTPSSGPGGIYKV
jgi:hypothetical protein